MVRDTSRLKQSATRRDVPAVQVPCAVLPLEASQHAEEAFSLHPIRLLGAVWLRVRQALLNGLCLEPGELAGALFGKHKLAEPHLFLSR